jgi:hypothetical protein
MPEREALRPYGKGSCEESNPVGLEAFRESGKNERALFSKGLGVFGQF